MSVYKSIEGKKQILDKYNKILDQWPVEHKKRYIKANGIETHIIESGSEKNPPLLLFHGSSSNSASWMGEVALWSRSFRVVAVDLPGEPGLSDETRLPFTGDEYAAWVKGIYENLSITRAFLGGISLGSWVVLKFASVYPEMVSKLFVLTTSGIAPPKVSFFIKALFLMPRGEKGIEKLNRIIFHKTPITREVMDFSILVMNNFNPVMEAPRIFKDEELSRLSMPFLYFGGTKDALLNTKKTAKRLKALLPRGDIRLLKSYGHVILNQGEEILDFLLTS